MATKMEVAQVSKAKGDFEIVEGDIPSPGPGQVRIQVQACGVCHSDPYTKEGVWQACNIRPFQATKLPESLRPLRAFRMNWNQKKRRRFHAQELVRSIRFVIAVPVPAIS